MTACAPSGPVETQATVDAVIAIIATAEARDVAAAEAQAIVDAPAPTATSAVESSGPVPNPFRIRLTTSVDTVYYVVDGTTTTEIFDSLEANGPSSRSETAGQFTAGLADTRLSLNYVESRGVFGRCEIESAEIVLSTVVTLPRHSNPSALIIPGLLGRWQAFKDDVTVHERRHVDISISRMEAFKHKLATDYSGRFVDCEAMSSRWNLALELENQEQDQFHLTEEQRSKRLRGPTELRIAEAEAELARLEDKLDSDSSTDAQLRSLISVQEQAAAVYQRQIDAIQASYPNLILPPDVFDAYEELRAQWNTHNVLRSETIADLNEVVRSRNQTAEEFNQLAGEVNELREELAWLP